MMIQTVAIAHTPFQEKFAIPRQPGLAPAARGRIVLQAPFDRPEALRGLELCSHIWLLFEFHQALPSADAARPPTLQVRPPRLGGNKKIGVFASRSPYRPNRLGQSLVKLEAVRGTELWVSGIDLLDGTPIVDIKPYLPYADKPQGGGGFAHCREPNADDSQGGEEFPHCREHNADKPQGGGGFAHCREHNADKPQGGGGFAHCKEHNADRPPEEVFYTLAAQAPPCIEVCWQVQAREQAEQHARRLGEPLTALIEQCLAQDPKPAYQQPSAERWYGVRLWDINVRWNYPSAEKICVQAVERCTAAPMPRPV